MSGNLYTSLAWALEKEIREDFLLLLQEFYETEVIQLFSSEQSATIIERKKSIV